jgi:hypothetical protein
MFIRSGQQSAAATSDSEVQDLTQTLEQIVSKFGQATRAKLGSAPVQGEPEDQLRTPFEHLLLDLAELAGVRS